MAIADYDTFLAKRAAPWQTAYFAKNSLAVTQAGHTSLWTSGGAPAAGATPSTPIAPTSATTGDLFGGRFQNSSGTQRIIGHECTSNNRCMFWIADRLSTTADLSGTVTTAQTTDLATPALTRYTDGADVFIALEIYSAVGTTATTVTVSYTDGVNGAGRTTPARVFGGSGNREVGRLLVLPLQQEDNHPVSVESVTVLASTTTAGNFGVTLFKPLYSIFVPADDASCYDLRDSVFGGFCNFPEVQDDACLFVIGFNSSTGNFTGRIFIAED